LSWVFFSLLTALGDVAAPLFSRASLFPLESGILLVEALLTCATLFSDCADFVTDLLFSVLRREVPFA